MDLFSVAVTLFLVFDPFGNIPAFLSILSQIPAERRRRIIVREMIIALIVLMLFLFFGKYILAAMRISEPALGIAGGIVLFLIAVRMIFPGSGPSLMPDPSADDPLVVPLAVPLIAGPSAMTMIILFSSRYESRMMLLSALVIAWAAASLILILADALRDFLGSRFFSAMERLMGLILTTVAVQMFLDGVREYMRT